MPLADRAATWTVVQDSAANTAQTATKAAQAGARHYVTGVEVAVSGAAVGSADISITLKDGTTAKWKTFIGAAAARGTRIFVDFSRAPIEMSVNTAVNLAVDAGGASVITTANIVGYTQSV
jgi:hypothetical protein